MLCYLFLQAHPVHSEYVALRAVSWKDCERVLTPEIVRPSREYLAWVHKHGGMVWQTGANAKQMMKALNAALDYWPEPIDVKEVKEVKRVDDIKKLREVM